MVYDQLSRSDTRRQEHIIRSLVRRGVVSDVDASKKMQTLNVYGLNGHQPTKVEHWERYGHTIHPLKGAEVLVAALGGDVDHLVAIDAADRRHRPKDLQPGEQILHDDQGQSVHIGRDAITISTGKKVVINGNIEITGNITMTGNFNQSGVHTDSNGPHTA